ncbi:hypothetical protein Slin15195_G052440 [Septoria linicola]|uniref:Uncharacterized protein n=1 Tax=Septoria linicola TaxID=215465 RepID=A0A9Q9ASV3_9PEZI|nr:hypothetical protein Slin14017_G127920 [Septoria linicola]USW51925.1 hypothetical protein Slin15195_G052440 [Septoria linicola]
MQYEYPPPPAGSSPSAGSFSSAPASVGVAHGGTHGQRSPYLPSITTQFLGQQAVPASQASTPVSANHLSPHFSYNSPRTPSGLNTQVPSGLTPSTSGPPPRTPSMEPYNPQQWRNRGQVSGSQMVFQRHANMPMSTANATGMEAAMPSPPPPYSPSPTATPDHAARAAVGSPLLETGTFTASPLADRAVSNSPQISAQASFPPPPSQQSSRHRERSASGLSQRALFSLSGLRGKQPAVEVQQQQLQPAHNPAFVDARPPAARRAASTGHIYPGGSAFASSSTTVGRSSPDSHWQPGMTLPGPPAGAPPPGMRSQSLNRSVGSSGTNSPAPERATEPPRQRRAMVAPSLGPVPPTPADWVERDERSAEPEPPLPNTVHVQGADYQPLRIDTGAQRENSLARRPARRDTSSQGIRERRSRSRATNGPSDEVSRPGNLIFAPEEGSISRRREHMRSASGYGEPSSAPSSSGRPPHSASKLANTVLTPPYTPAVAKQAIGSGRNIRPLGSAASDRPISHLLHTPNEEGMPAPLSPARPPSAGSTKAPQKLDTFALQAIDRHCAFVEKEANATSDEERLELFASFLVHESRVRRDRYSTAYNAMASDILDLTRDMWRSYNMRGGRRAVTPSTSMSSIDPSLPAWASDSLPTSAHGMPSSASSLGEFTPATDTGSNGDFGEGFERGETRQWADSFKPSLSPIPSMAVSTVPDENSSRGRTASRWWEGTNSGAGSIGRPDRMEKTRRETKYMGIDPAALQVSGDATPEQPSAESSAPAYMYGDDEYPPEKVGWHDAELDTPMQTPHRPGDRRTSTPGMLLLDVSRLVTLPPPFPRHHPAVNNSHPLLQDLRTEHRILSDHSEVQKIKDAYLDQDFALTKEQQESARKRRSTLRAGIQSKIADGSMSFADAAKAEAEFDIKEADRGKATARSNFDVFEGSVSHPLNTLLTERLQRANDAIRQLRADLESGHQSADPNRALEEGDQHPERLEKLTLLKWMFEAREQLHKEMFDLHAMRSDKYSEVILTPYRIAKAQAKIDEATTFFRKDSMERQATYAKDSLKRFEELQAVLENNVSRGVEDQLSAFWDIAPGLLEVVQQIPMQMSSFEVQIPAQEFEENPSYHDHPLQYLLSLLGHAEKSAYQFIESQINLLCLLHEVRTATTKARLRKLEVERSATDYSDTGIRADMLQARREAEDHLTHDLKDKVGEVERQWQEAIGDVLKDVKERVGIYLEETGGLEDELTS